MELSTVAEHLKMHPANYMVAGKKDTVCVCVFLNEQCLVNACATVFIVYFAREYAI